jgi:hypothetical protein
MFRETCAMCAALVATLLSEFSHMIEIDIIVNYGYETCRRTNEQMNNTVQQVGTDSS